MTDSGSDLQVLRERMSEISERLDGMWAEQLRTHLHLDRSTPECAYWHSGYHQALADVIRLIAKPAPTYDTADRSSQCLVAC